MQNHNDALPPHIVDIDTITDDETTAPADTATDSSAPPGEDWTDVPAVAAEPDAPAVPPVAVRPARPMPGLPAPLSAAHFAVLAGTAEEIEERLAANGALGPTDLDRITVPAAGGQTWTVPTINGTATPTAMLEGVIAAYADRRAYWSRPIGENAGTPPDCSSKDGVRGEGDPGGQCAVCPKAQFGSAPTGRGQACRLTRELLLFLPDSHLPVIVVVPPSSHGEVAKFIRRLPVPSYCALVRLALAQERSEARIIYSVIRPQFVAPLDAASRERFAALHRQLVAVTAS